MKINFVKILSMASLLAVWLSSTSNLEAQRIDDVSNILQKFKNYRFGAVNIYQITTPDELKEILNAKRAEAAGLKQVDESAIENIEARIVEIIREGVLSGSSESDIQRTIITSGFTPPPADEFAKAYKFIYDSEISSGPEYTPKAYLVTSRPERGKVPDRIIGLLYMEVEFADANKPLRDDLSTVSIQDIYSYDRLKDFDLDPAKYGYSNLYEFVFAYFYQGNVENKTMEARGIGLNDTRFFDPEFGNTSSIISSNMITSRDVQMFKRISEGKPETYYGKSHELTISPDQISWVKYEPQYLRDRRGNIMIDTVTGKPQHHPQRGTNQELPQFGVEVKYGMSGLNYPSLWSNRMTVSALWRNVKFGIILPTDGWGTLSEDLFSADRTMTFGGVGIAGELDFPFVLIKRSDVFQLSFGYVFGDANPASFKNRETDPLLFQFNPLDMDYMVRFNSQLHYTFGLNIDKDYYMRFGIGATGYSMENWRYETEMQDDGTDNVVFNMNDSEFIGGLSGKIEFMTTNNTTPFGGSIQYFDESLNFNAWVQVPIVDNTFSLRLEANGYYVAFRNTPRAWERESLFIPMARLVYVF